MINHDESLFPMESILVIPMFPKKWPEMAPGHRSKPFKQMPWKKLMNNDEHHKIAEVNCW